jgi:HMG (high mobility group) box
VDDAIRDFKERQKRKLDVAFVSTSCNGTKRSTSAKRSGQALEQEAREVMKQYWKRCKTSIEKSYHTTFSTGNTYENDVANAPVPQSISCPMSRRFSSDYSIATPPAPISAHLQSCNNENKYVGTSMVEPQKNLSAYNFFFHDERDRILNGGQCDYSSERQECLLQEVWNRSTPKRTSSTTIPFTTLSKMISQRWRDLPESQRAFYNHIAAKDSCRYQQQMHEYNMTKNMQPTSKAFP